MTYAGLTSAQATATAATPAAAANAADDSGLQEVVVTAERRTESAQKTALEIQVLSSDDLTREGIVSPAQLYKLVPGLNVSDGQSSIISLRGLGSGGATGLTEQSLAFNVDGVYIGQPTAVRGNFFDLARVELLKGPQGTLYGRNSTAGAMNVITNQPTHDLSADASVELGNYSEAHVTGALNVPFGDSFAVRAAFLSAKHDGYMEDGFSDEDELAGRIKALWTPTDKITVQLTGAAAQDTGKGPGTSVDPPPGGNPWLGPTNPAQEALYLAAGGFVPNPNPDSWDYNRSVYGQIDWDLGFATLTELPDYGWSNNCIGCGVAVQPLEASLAPGAPPTVVQAPGFQGAQIGSTLRTDQFSNELRLAKATERLKWVAGLYYFREHSAQDNHVTGSYTAVNNPAGGTADVDVIIPRFDTDSYAAFGEATYSLRPDLRLTGGVRYTTEQRTTVQYIYNYGAGNIGPASEGFGVTIDPLLGVPIRYIEEPNHYNSARFKHPSYKAGIEYDVAPQSMLFFTYATGFKSGGFYPGAAPQNLYQPEYLTSYTVGSKNRFFDNKLQLNLEAYYWRYTDQQISHIGVDGSGSLGFVTNNAGEATIKGVSADIAYKMTPADTIQVNAEYDDSYYNSFVFNTPGLPIAPGVYFPLLAGFGVGCPLSGTPGGVTGFVYTANCSGRPMILAPSWSGTASYMHNLTLPNGGMLTGEADVQATSSRYLAVDYVDPQEHVGGYALLDLSLTYMPQPGSKWTLTAWGRNVTNRIVFTGVNAASVPGVYTGSLDPPRTYGVRVDARF